MQEGSAEQRPGERGRKGPRHENPHPYFVSFITEAAQASEVGTLEPDKLEFAFQPYQRDFAMFLEPSRRRLWFPHSSA